MIIIRQNRAEAHKVLNLTSASEPIMLPYTVSQNMGTFGALVSVRRCLPQKGADPVLGGGWEPTEDLSRIGRD